MSYVRRMLMEAAMVSRLRKDDRRYFIGAIGLRSDGTKVKACNGNPKEPTREHHCEYRLSRKLDRGSTVFVARTTSKESDGCSGRPLYVSEDSGRQLSMAKPCADCEKALRFRGVARVYYSISDEEYGVLCL